MTLPGTPVRGTVAVRGAAWQSPPAADPEVIDANAPPPAPPALCGLPSGTGMALLPRPVVAKSEVRQFGTLFVEHDPLLTDSALAVHAARKLSLEARPFESAPAPVAREIEPGRTRRLTSMPVSVTAEIERAVGCLKPVAPSALGGAGWEPWAPKSPNRLDSLPRAPEKYSFSAQAAQCPGSAGIRARHLLESAAELEIAGRALAGAVRTASVEAAIVAAGRDPELLNPAAAARTFRLANAAHVVLIAGRAPAWSAVEGRRLVRIH